MNVSTKFYRSQAINKVNLQDVQEEKSLNHKSYQLVI